MPDLAKIYLDIPVLRDKKHGKTVKGWTTPRD
jgi:hypothetical protein